MPLHGQISDRGRPGKRTVSGHIDGYNPVDRTNEHLAHVEVYSEVQNASSVSEGEVTENDQLLQSPSAESGLSTKGTRNYLSGNEISKEAGQVIVYKNCKIINNKTTTKVRDGTGNTFNLGDKNRTQTTIKENRSTGNKDTYSLESMESSNGRNSRGGDNPENQSNPNRPDHNMPQQFNADVCAESESEAIDTWRTKELSTVKHVPNLKCSVLKEKEELLKWKELDELDALITSLPVIEVTGIPNKPNRKGRDYCEKEIPLVEKQEFMSRTDQIFPNDRGKDETKQRTCPEFMSINKMQYYEAEEYSTNIPFKELHPVKSGTNITHGSILNKTVSHETGNGVTSLIKDEGLVANLNNISVNIDETFHGGKDGQLIENQTQMQERTCPDTYGRNPNMQEYVCSTDGLEMVIEDEGSDKSVERNTLYKENRKETPPDNKDSDEITPELQLLQSENGTGMILQNRKDGNKSDYPISQTWNLRNLSDTDIDIDSDPDCRILETTDENKQIFINTDSSDGLAKHLSLEKFSKGKCSTIKEREDQITTEKQILERDGQAFVSCNKEHIYISADKPREIKKGALTDMDDADISPEKCESGKSQVSYADDSILVIHTSPPAMELKSNGKDLWETTFPTVEEKQQYRSGTDQICAIDREKDETKQTYSKITFTNKTQFYHAEEYSVDIPFKDVNLVKSDTDRILNENAGHETGNAVTSLPKEIDTLLLFTEAPSVQHTVSDESVTACVSDEQNNSSQDRIREHGESDCIKSAKPSYTKIRKQYHPKMRRTTTCYRNIKFFKGKVKMKNPKKILKGPLPLGSDTRKMTIPDKRKDSKREKRMTVVDMSRMVIPQGGKTDQVDTTPIAYTAHQNENKLENSFDYRVDEQKMSEEQKPQSFTEESFNELVAKNGSNRSLEDKNRIDRSDNDKNDQNQVENLSGLSAGREETFDGWKEDHELIKNQTEIQELTCPDKYGRFQNMQASLYSSDRLEMVIEDEGIDTSAERNNLYKENRKETPYDDKDSDESTPELQLLQSENGTGTILQNRKDSNKLSDYPISPTWNLINLFDPDLDIDSNPECRILETTSENKPLFINEDTSDGLGKHLSLERDSKGQHPSNMEREDQITENQILEREGRRATLSCSEEHIDISAYNPTEIKNETLTGIDEANIKPSIHQYVSTCAYISSEKCESGKSQSVSDEDDASSNSESSSFMDAVKYAIKNGDGTYVRQYLETHAWEHEDEIPRYLEYSLAFQDSDGIPTMTMVFLSWICMELTKIHKPYTVTVWPATLPGPGEDRFQELPVLVCNYWDDVREIYSGRSFFGLNVKYKEYNTVNDEELCVKDRKEFLEKKLSRSDAILANEILSKNTDWLMNSHSNLEIIKPCHIRIIRSEVFYETCIVLYCRSKGYIPFHENLFPKTLTFQDKSLPVDVREGFFVPAMMQDNSSFTNAGGNMHANAAGDEEAWDHNLFRMGISMGPYDKPISATVGPFVRIGENDVGFLTCAHAFGIPCNVDSVVTKAVVSPAKEESPPTDDFIPIHNIDPTCGYVDKIRFDNDPKHDVNVDAALIRLISNKQPRKGRFPWMTPSDLEQAGLTRGQILKFDDGEIVTKTTIEQGELTSGKFIKVGAASGVTSSNYLGHEHAVIKFRQVADLSHVHGSLYPPVIGGTRFYVMKGQYVIYSNFRKNFITLGDSGSGVFHMDDQRKLRCIGIGIGFMNYGREAVVTPIEDVLKTLELQEDALMNFSLAPTTATMADENHESN